MKLVAVTQRVDISSGGRERRDALDQAWAVFLGACGLTGVPVPNHPVTARYLLDTLPVEGVLLTGGNDLTDYGGTAPERDETERALLEQARHRHLPVVGVCRGMQVIQRAYGISLEPVTDHVAASQVVLVDGVREEVNSYHMWGTRETDPALAVWARAEDGVVEAVRDSDCLRVGIMWHPERFAIARPRDVSLFQQSFGCSEQ